MPKFSAYLVALVVLLLPGTLDAGSLGTGFTYQGTLAQNGMNVTANCDFEFGLWDAAAGGAEVAAAVDILNVPVADGVFTVELDYGAGVFGGDARWLAIAVACPAGGGLTTLAPRQELTPSPNALFAARAGVMAWTGLLNIPPDIADGDDVDDADADPANELQDLELSGNTLSLTGDASPVDLSGYLDNTDDQTLAEVLAQGNDADGTTITNLPAPVADSDASTKAYVDSQGGAQDLTDVLTQGNDADGITITNLPAPVAAFDAATKGYTDAHTDDDSDPTNEFQNLSLAGDTLSLTGDASPVDLSGYLDDTDDQTLAEVLAQGNDAGGTTISNLPAPVEDAQAATKGYVDSQAEDQSLAEVLAQGNDAGGITITNLPAPIAASDAATMAYVDAQAEGSQTLAEVLAEGNDAGGITITNLPGPVAASDASTKAYVDLHEDDDADPTNELQDLSLSSNTLSLTDDASPVDLSGYLDDTDDQTLAEVLAQGNNAGGQSITNIDATLTNFLVITTLDCTSDGNGGKLTTDGSGVVRCEDDVGSAGGGNTLDQAYDQGGPGAGRTITADAGPVTIQGIGWQALHIRSNFDPTLRVSSSSSLGEDTGLEIVGARNGSTTVDAAFIDLKDFDDNEGTGTEFVMARIGAGMQDVSGQTGFLRFYTNAGANLQEQMRIDKQGNVGIGPDSGTERFKVAGDAVIGGGSPLGLHDGNSEYLRIRGRVEDWYLGVRDAPTGPEQDFFIGLSDQDFTRFYFDRIGNLGLGTEPAADLHLASTGSQQIWIEADTDNSGESDQPSLVLTQDGGIISGSFGFLESRNHLSIRTNDVGAGVSHLLLEPEGRVGVGTGSPQNKLDVQGPGTTAGGGSGQVVARFRNTTANRSTGLSIDALADEDSILYFANDGTAVWDLRADPTHPDFEFPIMAIQYIGGAGVQSAMRFVAGGDEDGFFIVPGEDNETALGSEIGSYGAWQNIVTYGLVNLSDARLKSDVSDLDYGIEEISKLRPVRFRWSAHPEDGDRLGVIAQEVAPVIPEVVNSDENSPDTRMTVDYIQLVPVLIGAIQDQQQEIQSLRERVDRLQSNMQALARTEGPGAFEVFGNDEFEDIRRTSPESSVKLQAVAAGGLP